MARHKQTKEYKKGRIKLAKQLIQDNFGREVLNVIKKRYALYRGKNDLQNKAYSLLVDKGFSFREIASLTGKTHESIRHALYHKDTGHAPHHGSMGYAPRKSGVIPAKAVTQKKSHRFHGLQLPLTVLYGDDRIKESDEEKDKTSIEKVAESLHNIDKTLYGSIFPSLHKAREYIMVDEEEEEEEVTADGGKITKSQAAKSSPIERAGDRIPNPNDKNTAFNIKSTPEDTETKKAQSENILQTSDKTRFGKTGLKQSHVFVWSGMAKDLKKKLEDRLGKPSHLKVPVRHGIKNMIPESPELVQGGQKRPDPTKSRTPLGYKPATENKFPSTPSLISQSNKITLVRRRQPVYVLAAAVVVLLLALTVGAAVVLPKIKNSDRLIASLQNRLNQFIGTLSDDNKNGDQKSYVVVELPDGTRIKGEILNGEVKDGRLAGGTVIKTAAGPVTLRDVAGEGDVISWYLADGSVTKVKIKNAAVTNKKLHNGSVTNVKIAKGTITNGKIKDYEITGEKIASDGSVVKEIGGEEGIVATNNLDGSYTLNFSDQGIDVSNSINLAGGDHLTLVDDMMNVDDDFLLNTGDIGNGDYTFNGGMSVNGEVSVSGNLAVGTDKLTVKVNNGFVGMGDATPAANLVVGSDAGASQTNGAGDAYVQNDLEVGGTIYGSVSGAINPGFTAGSVVFQGPAGLTEDNNNFYFDNANNRLGIGTDTPSEQFHATDNIYTEDNLYVGANSETLANVGFTVDGDDAFIAGTLGVEGNVYTDNAFIAGSTLTLSDSAISESGALNIQVNGDTANYLTLTSDATDLTLVTTDLSDLYLKPAGDKLVVQNSVDATTGFQILDTDGGTPIVNVDTTNERLGIGNAAPNEVLEVTGNIRTSGVYKIGTATVLHNTGTRNLYVGESSGLSLTSGSRNTSLGYTALSSITSGISNVALGHEALYGLTTGINNVAIGDDALYSNNNSYNVAVGHSAATSNTSGTRNTVIGSYALGSNSTGSYNVALGMEAFYKSTASNNTGLGYNAGYNTTSGGNNVFVGTEAGFTNVTGTDNVFLGYQAGYSETGSNKLYIDNSNTASPLIYGDFSTNAITINGSLTTTGATGLNGNLTITKADPSIILDVTTATDTDFWMGVQDDAGGDDDDLFQIGDGTTPGTNPFLTVNTSGYVGIGTVTPNITGLAGKILTVSSTTSGTLAALELQGNRTGDNQAAAVIYAYQGANNLGSIYFLRTNSQENSGSISFNTVAAGSGAERVRISHSGYMGVNTTGPDRRLDILDASNPQLRLTYTDGTVYTDFQTGANGGSALTGSALTATGAIGLSDSFTITNATASASQYGEKLAVTSTGATASTLYGKHISFTDATATANTVYGLYVDAATGNAADTTYAAAFMNGNVGIGTTTPSTDLQIGSATFTGAYGSYSTSRNGLLVGEGAGDGTGLVSLQVSSTYNHATFPNYGLVLVNGSSTSSYDTWGIMHDGPAKAAGGLQFAYAAQGSNIHATTPMVTFQKTGNVGIGDTSPAANLVIGSDAGAGYANGAGDVYVQNDLEVDGTIYGAVTGGAGSFTTLTSSSTTNLATTGASNVNIATTGTGSTVIGNATGTLTLHGATSLDNTFTVSGNNLTSLGGNLTVTGTAWTVTPTISGLITATSGLTSNGTLTVAANQNLTMTSGTGTFTQTYTGTTTAATITSSSTTADNKTLSVSQTGATVGTDYGAYISNTGAVATTNVGLYSTASGGTNNYAAIFEAGNVGIGTTTPSYKLDVLNNQDGAISYIQISNQNASAGGGEGQGIYFSGASSWDAQIYNKLTSGWGSDLYLNSALNTYFQSGAATKMTLQNNGYVGIGTSSPVGADRKLDILDASNPQLRLTYTDGTVYTDMQTTSSGYLYVNASGDRVGIEDSTPSYTLDVNGDIGVAATEEYFIGNSQVLSKGNGSLTGNLIVGDGGGSLTHAAGNEGYFNTVTGLNAMWGVTSGYGNAAFGNNALLNNTTGYYNTALGMNTTSYNSTGSNNTAVGFGAGAGVVTNSYSNNTYVGYQSGYSTSTGGNNTVIGYEAGYSNATGASNVFLGYQAGYSETGSNKLYIDNSNTATPLIGGDFSTDTLTITGQVVVGSPTGGAKGAGTINAQAVYDDNVLLTDYVFDKYFDGQVRPEDLLQHGDYNILTIDQMGEYLQSNRHLPTIPGRDEWQASGKFSLGKMVNHLWETVETQAVYVTQLNEVNKRQDIKIADNSSQLTTYDLRPTTLEDRVAGLESVNAGGDTSPPSTNSGPEGVLLLNSDITTYIDQKFQSLDLSEKLQGEIIDSLNVSSITVLDSAYFAKDVTIKGQIVFNSDTVGQAEIEAGDTKVKVEFEKPYLYQPIAIVTPAGESALDLDFKYAVTGEDTFGFTIKIDKAQAKDIRFNWHAFAVDGGKIFVSDGTTEEIEAAAQTPPETSEQTSSNTNANQNSSNLNTNANSNFNSNANANTNANANVNVNTNTNASQNANLNSNANLNLNLNSNTNSNSNSSL